MKRETKSFLQSRIYSVQLSAIKYFTKVGFVNGGLQYEVISKRLLENRPLAAVRPKHKSVKKLFLNMLEIISKQA